MAELGRPRNFDAEAALDRALAVFWSRGFQGASLAELTAAMGLNKPSLYAAFGDKESLYLQALDRYAAQQSARHLAILDGELPARRAVETFLRSVAAMQTDPSLPGGCFIINGTADAGGPTTPPAVEAALRKNLLGMEAGLRERLLRAQREGELAPDARPDELAALFCSLIAGLGVQAKSGAKRAKLYAVINAAMGAWPEP
jgi:AcrR family transcriptional regulator